MREFLKRLKAQAMDDPMHAILTVSIFVCVTLMAFVVVLGVTGSALKALYGCPQ